MLISIIDFVCLHYNINKTKQIVDSFTDKTDILYLNKMTNCLPGKCPLENKGIEDV
jgi:hypothetical protein